MTLVAWPDRAHSLMVDASIPKSWALDQVYEQIVSIQQKHNRLHDIGHEEDPDAILHVVE